MGTSSTTDLVVRVLDLLGVTQVGQAPAAEDVEKVSQFIAGKVQDLTDRRVVTVDPTAIPDGYFEPLAKLVANSAGPAFGQPYDPDTDERSEDRLRLNQAILQGKFTRRSAAPMAEAEVGRQVTQGAAFVGDAVRPVGRGEGFVGETPRVINQGSSFVADVPRAVAQSSSFAVETPRAINQASSFAGETPRGLARDPTFAGDRPRNPQG